MKIIINAENQKNFTILLPMFFLKKRFFWNMICSNEVNEEKAKDALKANANLYKILKEYVKANGHFTLLNIESQSANIKIIV